MPNSTRMRWPYPNQHTKDWYENYETLVGQQDAASYAAREDRNLVLLGGDDVAWDAGTETLSWTVPFSVVSPTTGYRVDVEAGAIVVGDGEAFYIDLPRPLMESQVAVFKVAAAVPSSDTAYTIGARSGAEWYWRHGAAFPPGPTQHVQGMDALVAGDVWTDVGAVYLSAGTLLASSSVFAGDALVTNAAEVQLRDTGGGTVASWSVTGALAEDTLGADAVISTDGWYGILLRGDVPASEALLKGVSLVVI